MKKKSRLMLASGLLAAFAVWTAAVQLIDVQPIGPQGTSVGFAAMNGFVHSITGVHMSLYVLTDWLALVPVGIAAGFGTLGLCQWIRRKSIGKVDRNLLVLGGFYIIVMMAYMLFEMLPVNFRPVLIDDRLEASYPSSTTMLVMCVIPTAVVQLKRRIRSRMLKKWVIFALNAFGVLMTAGRLLSGVHWCTDIIASILLSAGLVVLYDAAAGLE